MKPNVIIKNRGWTFVLLNTTNENKQIDKLRKFKDSNCSKIII